MALRKEWAWAWRLHGHLKWPGHQNLGSYSVPGVPLLFHLLIGHSVPAAIERGVCSNSSWRPMAEMGKVIHAPG